MRPPLSALLLCLLLSAQRTAAQDGNADRTVEMPGVVVAAKTYSQDVSRENFIITDSLREGAHNLLQLIDRLPGFSVDWMTDEVKVGTERNVPVLVNGKNLGADYVKGLNPKRIRRIERLRYPKGKYGDAPMVVNVVLNNAYEGWDVDVHSSNLLSTENEHSRQTKSGVSATYTLSKWNFYGHAGYKDRKTYEAKARTLLFNGDSGGSTAACDRHRPNAWTADKAWNVSLGADFRIAPQHVVAAQMWEEWRRNDAEEGYSTPWQVFLEKNGSSYDAGNFTSAVYYDGQFGGRLATSNILTYNRYGVDEHRLFVTQGQPATAQYSRGDKEFWHFNTDWKWYFSSPLTATMGCSYTYKKYTDSERNGGHERFALRERRNECYASLSFQPTAAFGLSAGGKLLVVASEQSQEKVSHASFVPSLKAFWKLSSHISVSADYYNDVTYPNLDELSPIAYKVNSVVRHSGNPNLEERVMNYAEARVDFFDKFRLIYMFKHCNNDITPWYVSGGGDFVTETLVGSRYNHHYAGLDGKLRLPGDVGLGLTASYQRYKRWQKGGGASSKGRTYYVDAQLSRPLGRHCAVMAQYFLRSDKFPLLQGEQYAQEETLVLGAKGMLLKDQLSVTLLTTVPTRLLSKETYTRVSASGFSSMATCDERVNRQLVVLSLRLNLGRGHTSKFDGRFVNDAEKRE